MDIRSSYKIDPISSMGKLGLVNTHIALLLLLCSFVSVPALSAKEFTHLKVIENSQKLDKLNSDLATEHPLYKKIFNEFSSRYEEIGRQQAAQALLGKNVFVGGGLNKIGLRYSKSFIDFKVNIERQLSPDLFDDTRWIVKDTFIFEIEASKLLSKLSDEGTIEIGEEQFALFAGLSFKRKYTWIHFADSYNDGLTRNFQKLFLPFAYFKNALNQEIAKEEILKKEDFLTFSAGALGSLPIYGPLWASAGVLGHYKKMASVQVQVPGEHEKVSEDEVLRVQIEKLKNVEVGVRASLQADFLKILRITLLSYDFSYEYEQSYKTHLSFSSEDLNEISSDKELLREYQKGLKVGKVSENLFRPYILALEDSRTATLRSRYVLLLLSGMKEQDTTFVKIKKDETLKTFFRHRYEKSKYVMGLFSRIFSQFLASLLGLGSETQKLIEDNRVLTLDYESEIDLLDRKGKFKIKEENFSFGFERNFRVGKISKSRKKKATEILESYGGVDPIIWSLLRNNLLKGPLELRGKFIIKKDGIAYFQNQSYRDIYSHIKRVCGSFFCRLGLQKSFDRYWKEWSFSNYRYKDYKSCKPKFKLFQSARKRRFLWESCLRKRTLLTDSQKYLELPLWRFKEFANRLLDKTESKVDLYGFFGLSNVFLHGSFEAVDKNGHDFVSYFKEGHFKGLNVVDQYLKDEGL